MWHSLLLNTVLSLVNILGSTVFPVSGYHTVPYRCTHSAPPLYTTVQMEYKLSIQWHTITVLAYKTATATWWMSLNLHMFFSASCFHHDAGYNCYRRLDRPDKNPTPQKRESASVRWCALLSGTISYGIHFTSLIIYYFVVHIQCHQQHTTLHVTWSPTSGINASNSKSQVLVLPPGLSSASTLKHTHLSFDGPWTCCSHRLCPHRHSAWPLINTLSM